MRLKTFIAILLSSWTFYGQKKKDCTEKLKKIETSLYSQWKYVSSVVIFADNKTETKKSSDHILIVDKLTFSVKKGDSLPYQNGSIEIKIINPSKKRTCAFFLHFKNKGVESNLTWDMDNYSSFWRVEKCTSDSLLLCSPLTTDFIDGKPGSVNRLFIKIN